MDKMLCVDANIMEAIQPLIRQKKRTWIDKLKDKVHEKAMKELQNKLPPPPPPPAPPAPGPPPAPQPAPAPPPPPPQPNSGFDFTCVDPKFECKGLACSYCTDVDINPSSTGPTDNSHNCVPAF
ncbi:hypothetical protein Aduo_007724 [Ancylostoma duodenale]